MSKIGFLNMTQTRFVSLFVIFATLLTHPCVSLPVYPLDFNTIPGQPVNAYPNLYNFPNTYANPPYNTRPYYDPDGKWPAYGFDAPGNYHNYAKANSDRWMVPSNIPRWYDQPDGGRGLQGTQGWLWPAFYGNNGFPGFSG